MTPRTSAGRRHRPALAIALAAAALSLAACAGSGSSSGGSEAASMPDAPVAEAPAPATDAGTTDKAQGGAPLSLTQDRSIVVKADMTVQVADLAPATDQLAGIAARYKAVVASQTTSAGKGTGIEPTYDANGQPVCPPSGCPTTGYASSTTTLRVDNADVDALVADLEKLGTVTSSYRTTEDVTAEVADVDSRVKNAEASLARVRALMDKATSITDVVALEAELSKRQTELEAQQARQRALADQTAQATVTVRLVTDDAPVVQEPQTGFVAGLKAGWNAFTNAAVFGMTVLGALLPFLLALVPVALLAWWLVRRGQRPVAPPARDV